MNSRERCLGTLAGDPVDRVPVFPLLMFLAADRARMSYRTYATEGRRLAEAQVLMTEMFGIDAVTSCSDAFRVSADFGGKMVYPENGTPFLEEPIVSGEADLERIVMPDVSSRKSRMRDRTEATGEMVKAVGDERLVLGWVDMPFAEASSVCGVSSFMMMLCDRPALAHEILERLTPIVVEFALMQLETGAPLIGAGDASASLVSPEMYREFALPYEQEVIRRIHDQGGLVKLHVCGNVTDSLPGMIETGADLINVDHLVDFDYAAEVLGEAGICFKGNLHPVEDFLDSSPAECRAKALDRIRRAGDRKYMLSGGCEIPAEVSDEVFRAFCTAPRTRAAQNDI